MNFKIFLALIQLQINLIYENAKLPDLKLIFSQFLFQRPFLTQKKFILFLNNVAQLR